MKTQNKLTIEQQKLIKTAYVEEGRGQSYCAKIANTTIYQVKKFLKDENIYIRTYAEASRANAKNREKMKYKNENYFSVQSHNMAYILGFLASDGSISLKRNTIKIGLSKKDEEILKKIKQEIEIENKITEYETNTGFDVVELSWTCAKHKADLAKYGIIPQKTFILQPPKALNKEFIIDYIRGYFDGDGSICKSGNNLRFSICSATKDILTFIIDFFYDEYGIPKVSIYENNLNQKHTNYYFQYSTNTVKQIYNILYQSGSLYLERKKIKFEELLF